MGLKNMLTEYLNIHLKIGLIKRFTRINVNLFYLKNPKFL